MQIICRLQLHNFQFYFNRSFRVHFNRWTTSLRKICITESYQTHLRSYLYSIFFCKGCWLIGLIKIEQGKTDINSFKTYANSHKMVIFSILTIINISTCHLWRRSFWTLLFLTVVNVATYMMWECGNGVV